MAYNPNVPAPANRVQDDIAAMRGNFQHLAPLAQLAPAASELQTVSELAPYVQAILGSRIVEMGSNSNGTYVRWENGLQVCWLPRLTLPRQTGTQAYADWIFPAAFVDTNYSVHITQAWQANDTPPHKVNMAFTQNLLSTKCSVRLGSKDGDLVDGESWGVHLVAIGRWK